GVGEDEDVTQTQIPDYYDEETGRWMGEVVIPAAMRDGVWVGETPMRARDGKIVRVSAVIMAHRPSGQDVEYVSVIARDVTEKVRLEEQLRQAQKMEAIGSLAGGIAHDFNNLLTAIQGFSDLALTRLSNPEAVKRDLEEVRRAAVRAAALTRQLLIFSRQQVLEPRPVSVNLLVHELGKMLRRLIGEDIELTMSCEEPASMILADPGQIEQVIINLVVNARDAMPEGGELGIETSRTEIDAPYAATRPGLKAGSYVLLSVSDTGTGMSAETQARIFEPFFTTKEPGKGTGLGLATVYGIVKQCEGDVQVLSELGEGTTFNILLPLLTEPVQDRPADGVAASTGGGSETILVVEDEEAVRAVVRSSLALCGYTVLDARDGTEAMAVQATAAGPIHLVICDMVMPVMNGPEVAARLAQVRPEARILFMSGYAEKSILRRGIAHGAFLHKPFGTDTLARKVREVLDSPRPERETAAPR
ncbi:MAG TPA: ATP-binding protein, partial [Candidatus Saccharimonadales bacterium]|nr:ATP-binding protein [Candidatus Saccharimonadales bacterium]